MSEVKKPSKAENKELTAPAEGSVEAETKKALDKQPKTRVRLYQTPAGSSDEKLPPQPVAINGYVYLLERGVWHDVPEEVANILAESGHI